MSNIEWRISNRRKKGTPFKGDQGTMDTFYTFSPQPYGGRIGDGIGDVDGIGDAA